MSEFKGTPGPWFIADDALGNMTHIVLSKQYPFEMMSEENLALITAAPELLEALQKMFRAGQKQNWNERYESEMNAARAAIAKALGK
ncbi:hypothetical protein [Citrobacter werkmanii]|uniref:hypothetical protein n=1 Tax=Citrobacter werkmanii TaxID=67827 RepID=UPI0018A6A740|nr:hypothetical protein [Salmonella enterica subsp. enterica]BBV32127.1 hypothetical protein STW0522CIT01_36160 [Citrobacter freundii]BBV37138.1 hypothetical protein STW0522CIT19_36130 [Citrobacter freundii]